MEQKHVMSGTLFRRIVLYLLLGYLLNKVLKHFPSQLQTQSASSHRSGWLVANLVYIYRSSEKSLTHLKFTRKLNNQRTRLNSFVLW